MESIPRASAHRFIKTKDPELDRDRVTALTQEVATCFAARMNQQFAPQHAPAPLDHHTAMQFARVITESRLFPFTASAESGTLRLTASLQKSPDPVVKDISDGVTECIKALAASLPLGERRKFTLSVLFHPAISGAYTMAGLPEGSHTKYTGRSC
jgi:hypothetical protein